MSPDRTKFTSSRQNFASFDDGEGGLLPLGFAPAIPPPSPPAWKNGASERAAAVPATAAVAVPDDMEAAA